MKHSPIKHSLVKHSSVKHNPVKKHMMRKHFGPYLLRMSLLGLALMGLDVSSIALAQDKKAESADTVVVEPMEGVASVVNDSVISHYDLSQRTALFLATAGNPPPPDKMKQIRLQILKQLETERIQLLEAQRKNISVSAAEVDKAINNILRENDLTQEKLEATLKNGGVALSTLRSQIAVGIAWSKAVQDEYSDRINVTPEDVKEEMQRITESADKPRFLVSQIFLAVDSPEQEDKVRGDAEGLILQMQSGAPFAAVARQFSQNPSAAQGGDIGWVHEGQLQSELNEALVDLRRGELSKPIRSTGGFYIMALRERQEGVNAKLPDPATQVVNKTPPGTLSLVRILLPTGERPAKALLENAMRAAQMLQQRVENCEMAAKVPQAVQGAVFMKLGTMKLSDLSQQMQSELAKTGPGEMTDPFQSQAGIELIMRCDAAPPKITAFQMPTEQQVQQQLFEEQIATLSRQYMRNLRRTANVDTKYK